MKMFFIAMTALFISASANAQYSSRNTVRSSSDYSSNSGNSITGYLGFGQSAINLGADFEMPMTSDTGYGGYFFLLSDKKEGAVYLRPQLLTFGGEAKVHYRTGSFDFYGAPGFGLMLVDHTNVKTGADDDTTTIGPSMRIGVLYNVNPSFSIGLEHAVFFNWLADEIGGGEIQAANVAARFSM